MDASATRAGNTRPDPEPAGFVREVALAATCEPMLPPLRLSCASLDGRHRCQVVPVSAVLMALVRIRDDQAHAFQPTLDETPQKRPSRGPDRIAPEITVLAGQRLSGSVS